VILILYERHTSDERQGLAQERFFLTGSVFAARMSRRSDPPVTEKQMKGWGGGILRNADEIPH